jgi:hypothetical protein
MTTRTWGACWPRPGILAGLSDGREPNPVKRGAWFARKIVAEPPDDPPPNVPKLPEDDTAKLTLRQRLEQHRNQEGCAKCHTGIDPWGLPFEKYDAAGRFRNEAVESSSTLPDGAEVSDVNSLKAHLINDRLDQVAFSYLKHLACYATGRSLTYNELVSLRKESQELRAQGYGTRDLLKFVVTSDIFMKKWRELREEEFLATDEHRLNTDEEGVSGKKRFSVRETIKKSRSYPRADAAQLTWIP